MSSILDTLITDRVGGYYNASDLNRVAEAMQYVSDRLHAAGYTVPITSKTTWQIGDMPTESELATYVAEVTALRNALALVTPPAPEDMDDLTVAAANNIERILLDVDAWLTSLLTALLPRQANTQFMIAGGIFNV